jgi:hypothetical protein
MQKGVVLISGILETRRLAVLVVVARTGKAAWVPRSVAEWWPGKVVLPLKIAEAISGEGKKHGAANGV